MNLLGVIGYPLFFIAASEISLGALLLKQNPRNSTVNKTVAALSFILSLWCILAGIVYIRASKRLDYNLFYRACWVAWLGIPAAFQMIYSMKDKKSRNTRLAGLILYPLWTAILILCFSTDLLETGAYSLIPFSKRYGPIETPARLLGVALIVWIIYELIRLRKQSVSIRKAQLNYFLTGSIIFAIGAMLVSGLLQQFGGLGFDPALGSYFSLPWVALTYYSISRYRLFDIQIAVSRTLTAALLFVGAAAVHVGLFKLLEPYTGSTSAILISLSFVAALFFMTPLKRKVAGMVSSAVLKDKYGYQEILRESSRAVTTILSIDELMQYIINVVRNSLKVESACLFIKKEDGLYHLQRCYGVSENALSSCATGDEIVSWLMQTRQVFVREEQEMTRSAEDFHRLYHKMGKIGAELVIPLFYKGELLGVLTLGGKGNEEIYMQSDIDLLEAFASQAAIALENIRLCEEATTDGLTGLYAHKYFKLRLQEEMERARRYKRALSLLLIDIDHFKSINDEYGHLAGDKVLKRLSKAWREKIRMGDIIARYGGEEFAVILPETPKPDALKAAENLRAYTEEAAVEGIPVTISIGVGFYHWEDTDSDSDALIMRADRALYRAKRQGRNRVEMSE